MPLSDKSQQSFSFLYEALSGDGVQSIMLIQFVEKSFKGKKVGVSFSTVATIIVGETEVIVSVGGGDGVFSMSAIRTGLANKAAIIVPIRLIRSYAS